MRHLCDSNVFIAWSVAAHPHHDTIVDWVGKLAPGDQVAFCRATQNSYLRILTVREFMKENVCTNDAAIEHYRTLRSDSRIIFMEEPVGIEKEWLNYAKHDDPSPKRWMDAYLAAFANVSKARFVTFDRGFLSFRSLNLLLLRV